jgi:glycogen debranching enzyme
VVDEDDDTIRPNQIYAVSLPFTMLDREREKAIVDTVMDKLYVGCGLRSLDPDHKDYHPIYIGSLSKRDHAYHQGTAWGFLLGGFISAYVKEHLLNNCIGSICEIFDGDAPHNGRGCYAQAWSVGEVLRCYCEDVLPMLPQAHS